MKNKYWFTFGDGHWDDNHESLGAYYTTIEANSERDALIEMCALRADKWCVVYDNPGVVLRFGLTHIQFYQLTSQKGETK